MTRPLALLALLLGCLGHVPHQIERRIAYEVRDCEYGRRRMNPFWYARCGDDGDRACVTAGFTAGCWQDYAIEVERRVAYEVRDCEYGRLRANPFWYAECAEDGDRACVTAGFAPGCWQDYAIEVERGDTHWIGGP